MHKAKPHQNIRRMVCLAVLGALLSLMACSPQKPFQGQQSPFVYDKGDVQRADTLVFLIPGALAPIGIFDPARHWADQGYAPVYYRFPGMDGLALDHSLGIENAAEQIAVFARRYPDKRIRLLGYSTGGPIAILAGHKLGSGEVKVAAMSTAVPYAGGLNTALRVSGDTLTSAFRVGSFERKKVWLTYYRTLLYGHDGLKNPVLTGRIDSFQAQKRATLVMPSAEQAFAHSADLRRWAPPGEAQFQPNHIRFFVGLADPVFSTRQTQKFSRRLGGVQIIGYPDQGHLLFLTRPDVFDDVLRFFEETN